MTILLLHEQPLQHDDDNCNNEMMNHPAAAHDDVNRDKEEAAPSAKCKHSRQQHYHQQHLQV